MAGVGHGEIRVEFHRPLVEGQSGGVPFRKLRLPSQAVGFQRLQRWRGRFLQRRGVLLHRAERFAQLAAQADRRSVQSLEHRFLARRLLLRFGQHVPRVAVHRLQANHVLAAQPGNRAGQHGLAARALADLARHLRRQPVTGGTAHQLQCLVHLALGNQVEKGRLLKLYRESLLQRVVEDRVAGLVVKVGEDDGVFVGELGWHDASASTVTASSDNTTTSRSAARQPFPSVVLSVLLVTL